MKRLMIAVAFAAFAVAGFGGFFVGDVLVSPDTTFLARSYPDRPPSVPAGSVETHVRYDPVPPEKFGRTVLPAVEAGGRVLMEERPVEERFPEWDLALRFAGTTDSPEVQRVRTRILAWRLSRGLTRARMIDLLVNISPCGDGTYGIESASLRFFHKPARMLAPEEGAALAGRVLVAASGNRTADEREIRFLTRRIHEALVREGEAFPDFEGRLERPLEQSVSPVDFTSEIPPGVLSPTSPHEDGRPPAVNDAPPAPGLPGSVSP